MRKMNQLRITALVAAASAALLAAPEARADSVAQVATA
jgi:hypothetical protein